MPDSTEAVTWTTIAPGVMRFDLTSPPANALGLAIVQGLQKAMMRRMVPATSEW